MAWWCSGYGCRTSDQQVASSTPGPGRALIIIITGVPLTGAYSRFHKLLPTSSVLGVSPCCVQAMIERLKVCFQGPNYSEARYV